MAAVPQLDLFAPDPFAADHAFLYRRSLPSSSRRAASTITPDQAAQILDGHEDYRILRRLKPRPIAEGRTRRPGEGIVVVIDTETTGLDHRADEVIELGMVACLHNGEGVLQDVIAVFSSLRQPTVSITPQITRLTGITPEMVLGHAIDIDAVEAFIAEADLVVAHNARFDRPFCERLAPGFISKAWACSVKEVDWAGHGFEGAKLGSLVGSFGWFHNGHRAVDDCHALLEVLATPLPNGSGPALRHLLAAARRDRIRVWAEATPYAQKDRLKGRGYRWSNGENGAPKAWWIEVDEEGIEAEMSFLQQEVYGWEASPRVQRLSACERFRAD